MRLMETAVIHWSHDNWQTTQEIHTRDTGLGLHIVDLPTEKLGVGAEIVFTFRWLQADRWQGENFTVQIQ